MKPFPYNRLHRELKKRVKERIKKFVNSTDGHKIRVSVFKRRYFRYKTPVEFAFLLEARCENCSFRTTNAVFNSEQNNDLVQVARYMSYAVLFEGVSIEQCYFPHHPVMHPCKDYDTYLMVNNIMRR